MVCIVTGEQVEQLEGRVVCAFAPLAVEPLLAAAKKRFLERQIDLVTL